MTALFLILEIFFYAFSLYLLLVKKELAIIYLPVLFFLNAVITIHKLPAFVYYLTMLILILNAIRFNPAFFLKNIFSLLLVVYFLTLLTEVNNFDEVRPSVFNVFCFFIILPLISSIFEKYEKSFLINEVAKCAFLVLTVFVLNTLASSKFGYDVHSMYGITKGILYGNLYASDFNIIPMAIFILLISVLYNRSSIAILVALVSLALLTLTVRRSVIGIGFAGLGIFLVMFAQKNAKMLSGFVLLSVLLAILIIPKTSFVSSLTERIENRQLDERVLEEEGRTMEYSLLYKDMVIDKKYSIWFGFKLFDSKGNYGGGVFGDRSLHGDLTSILHSSGLVGLILYLMMVGKFFYTNYRRSSSREDVLLLVFGSLTFVVFTLTGRYTEAGCMLLLFMVCSLPSSFEAGEEELLDEDDQPETIEYEEKLLHANV